MYYYFFYPLRERDWVYMHVEKVERENGVLLIDFRNEEEYERFLGYAPTAVQRRKKAASMIEVRGAATRFLKEDATYVLTRSAVLAWYEQGSIIEVENSLIIGYRVEAQGAAFPLFDLRHPFRGRFWHWAGRIEPREGVLAILPPQPEEELELVVRNVGQGNWNELRTRVRTHVVYDVGAAWPMTAPAVQALAAPRDQAYLHDRPHVIISHWDVDHFHALRGLSDAALAALSTFLCRPRIPNRTCMEVMNRVLALNPAVVRTWSAEPRQQAPGELLLKEDLGWLKLFNARRHSVKNRSGIMLAVERANSTAILPADHHYVQVSHDVLPQISATKEHHLVVPHHGGSAGNMVYQTTAPLRQALVSVGPNGHGHPNLNVTTALTQIGFNVQTTVQANTDIVIPLP